MEKMITINEHEITLSNATEWLFVYQDQFGQDIVETLTPAIAGLIQVAGGIFEEMEGDELSFENAAKIYNSEAIQNALIYFSAIKITDLINITWAMAKAAKSEINPPREWIREIGEFPLDIIGPAIFELLLSGFTSSKNWERLQENFKKLQPKKKNRKK